MKRRTLREQIFKLLFRVEFNDLEEMPAQARMFFESGDIVILPDDQEYIEARCNAIIERLPEIDDMLEKGIEGWKFSRVGKVEKTLLRLAVYEMKFDKEVPAGVAISEAVELSKKYGQENAASFVNGVLAKFTKDKTAEE